MKEEYKKIQNEYLEYLKLKQKDYKNYKSSVKQYLEYLIKEELKPLNIKINDARDYQQYLTMLSDEDGKTKYSSITIRNKIECIISFYDYLEKNHSIIKNPFREINKSRVEKKLPENILNEEDFSKLANGLKNFMEPRSLHLKRRKYRAHLITELMYSTGMRVNEAAGLTLDDIDFTRGTVKIKDTKSGHERTGFLNGYTERILKIYKDEFHDRFSEYINGWRENLFFGSGFQSITRLVNKELEKETEKQGLLKITSHIIRHAVGVHLLRAGCDIRYIQEILGHKDIGNTQIYTRIDKTDLRNIIDKYHPRTFKGK